VAEAPLEVLRRTTRRRFVPELVWLQLIVVGTPAVPAFPKLLLAATGKQGLGV
jgi:hypothetical protein